jgi:hypothetical protein
MKCTYIKTSGEECNANATSNSNYCFTHNPEYAEQKALAVQRGGANRKHYEAYGEAVTLETPKDIKVLLSKVINGVWTGNIPSTAPANTIGFLARCFLDAHEDSDLEERLIALEDRLNKAGL